MEFNGEGYTPPGYTFGDIDAFASVLGVPSSFSDFEDVAAPFHAFLPERTSLESSPEPPLHSASPVPLPVARTIAKASQRPASDDLSNTRRCRAKLNSKLHDLLELLPTTERAALGPFPSTSDHAQKNTDVLNVKNKAQVIGLAVDRVKQIRARNMVLEMRLAMSSRHRLRGWVRSVANASSSLTEALQSFLGLICLTRGWKYAELWEPTSSAVSGPHLRYVAGSVPPSITDDDRRKLRAYRTGSKRFKFGPRAGVPGRVYVTKQPEWLPHLDDVVAFPRARYAVEHQVRVTFAVPVLSNGQVRMVAEFFDTCKRRYDPQSVDIAQEIAALLGSAFDVPQHSASPIVTTRVKTR